MRTYPEIGIQFPKILLPKYGTDMQKWATIACDQFTSEPEYWDKVAEIADNAPSTFNLVLPEVYLGTDKETERLKQTNQTMRSYLEQGLFDTYTQPIYIERTSLGKTRKGLMIAVDLERYDFSKGSQSLIRATEGTILDRLPPRIRIREGATLELPHILILIDDPDNTVIGPVETSKASLDKIYDFDLMLGSGHLAAWNVSDTRLTDGIVSALGKLADPDAFHRKYDVGSDKGVLLFAVGDGNHSLATAKSIWESIKDKVGMDHPARYAMVELENVHDSGLEFEPIHRVLFGINEEPLSALTQFFGDKVDIAGTDSFLSMKHEVDHQVGAAQKFGLVDPSGTYVVSVTEAQSNLPVGTLQGFLDAWVKSGNGGNIDYVHGADVVKKLGAKSGNCGFYLPGMKKTDLFKTVILDGALPRKTFSMGEAVEKRFYVEARKIRTD